MGNLIMIVGLLWPHSGNQTTVANTANPAPTNERILGQLAEGMSKDELLKEWGMPTHFEKSKNFYSGHNETHYHYLHGPCAFRTRPCSVIVEEGKIARFDDIKADLIKD